MLKQDCCDNKEPKREELKDKEYCISCIRKTLKKTEEGQIDTQDLWHILMKSITMMEQHEETNPAGCFGNIYGGYES